MTAFTWLLRIFVLSLVLGWAVSAIKGRSERPAGAANAAGGFGAVDDAGGRKASRAISVKNTCFFIERFRV